MLAKSQNFNDNVGNNETDLCFHCGRWKTKDEFLTDEGKNVCIECFKEYEQLCKEKETKFIEKIGREAKTLFGQPYYLNDVFAVVNGKEFFIRGYNPIKQGYNFPSQEKASIFNLKIQFLKSDKKFICFYGSNNEDGNPLKFVEFLKKNNYSFGKSYNCGIEYLQDLSIWEFSGNLKEVSNAFCFRIFNKEFKNQLVELIGTTLGVYVNNKGMIRL